MSPADGLKALAAAIGLAVAVFKIAEAHRAELPEGTEERMEVERMIAEATDALRELWLYEPQNPQGEKGT